MENKNQPSCLGAVSGSIRITKAARLNQRSIITHCNWFDNHEYFIVKDDGKKIIFKKCFMEVPKKAYKLTKAKTFTVLSDAEMGTFEICSDETNEDEAVVYYR